MAELTKFSELSDEAIVHRLLAFERELVQARFQHSMGQLENTATLSRIRRDMARLRTEARRREMNAGAPKDSIIRVHRATYQAAVGDSRSEERGGFLQGIVDKLSDRA
jgi:large subunit ribosomal protein L29